MTENKSAEVKPYAVVKTSGKQFRVSAGDRIRVNQLKAEVGSTVTLSEVLAISSGAGEFKLGAPVLSGATVTAKVVAHGRAKKVVIFKKRRRKGYTKKQGHRQNETTLLIESI
ncbi:MAG: 50S ribosomal protein L21 [Proteobacteria bacterium]|nr:50S ribosomal protein L21 [Pseudomonadota bacterium]